MATRRRDIPQHYYTLEEYFALEKASDARFEYWDGDILCMSGGSEAHSRISSRVHFRVSQRLEGGRCQAFTGDLPIKTPTLPPYRYPDVTIACGQLVFEHIQNVDALVNPTAIIEVLSPTTSDHDRNEKFKAYKAISSFTDYILIAQDMPHVTHHVREPDGSWARRDLGGLDAVLAIDSIDCALALAEIYEGVSFDAD
ncbi:MAG TPA: Uma2 family endonuclease [Blastocatellia bacterium]|nr:Uma2 family endonuclease [Blastocatellia bacterium]